MKLRLLTSALAAAGLLAACGGGSTDALVTTATSARVSLTGVASKGLMANADVSVHPIKSDGTVDLATTLATATTNASGDYSLTFDATKDQPYVIRVAAKADGSTTHLDEVSGVAQPLPAGFVMRSLLTATSTEALTVSASITPFSEMAVSAAAAASGGITAANASSAVSSVTQLLGFNPTTVSAKTVGTAGTADEQKLAVMLAAVSQLASDGSLGCATGSAGDKTKCVVDKLASSSSTTSIALTSGTTNVSSALSAALLTVLSNDRLRGAVASSTLTSVVSNLACVASACTTASSGTTTTADPVATGIAAAKTLFAEIKSDWSALFSKGGATSLATGATNIEAYKIRTALTDVEVPAETMAKDVGALLMGINLYNDYKAGRTTVNGRGQGPAPANNDSAAFSTATAVGCTVYKGTDTSAETGVPATNAAEAGSVGCAARYYMGRASSTAGAVTTNVTTQWRHGFSITPQPDGSFNYGARARKRVDTQTCNVGSTCTSVLTANEALQINASAGTLTPVSGSDGRINSFTLTGEIPGAFKRGTNTLANDHHTWAITGTTASAADGLTSSSTSRTTSIAGNIVAYSDATTKANTLTVKSGKIGESDVAVTSDGSTELVKTLLDLDVAFTTATAEVEGAFKADQVVLDKSGTDWAPTRVSFVGALRSINSSTVTEVMTVSAAVTAAGYASYDATLPGSTTNFFTPSVTATGTVSAPGRPVLEFSVGMSKRSNADEVSSATFQYRRLVAGAPRTVISGTGTRAADGTMSFTLGEATSNLSMSWTGEFTSADLKLNGSTKIGAIDSNTKMLTFMDGSFMSLDIGL